MAGKKKSEKESSWIGEIEKYSRQIWLAGLGAYSKVSKDGSKLFETLVKDGEKAEKEAKSDVDAQVGAAKASARSAKSKVDEVRDLSLIHISEPTRQAEISYAVFCLKKKKQTNKKSSLDKKNINHKAKPIRR